MTASLKPTDTAQREHLPCRERPGTESVILALQHTAVTESALKHKLWAPRIFDSAVPGYHFQGRRMVQAPTIASNG